MELSEEAQPKQASERLNCDGRPTIGQKSITILEPLPEKSTEANCAMVHSLINYEPRLKMLSHHGYLQL